MCEQHIADDSLCIVSCRQGHNPATLAISPHSTPHPHKPTPNTHKPLVHMQACADIAVSYSAGTLTHSTRRSNADTNDATTKHGRFSQNTVQPCKRACAVPPAAHQPPTPLPSVHTPMLEYRATSNAQALVLCRKTNRTAQLVCVRCPRAAGSIQGLNMHTLTRIMRGHNKAARDSTAGKAVTANNLHVASRRLPPTSMCRLGSHLDALHIIQHHNNTHSAHNNTQRKTNLASQHTRRRCIPQTEPKHSTIHRIHYSAVQ